MEKFGKVDLYLDDFEIVDILKDIPNQQELGNKSILQFLEQDAVDNNIAIVCGYNDVIYTIYKLDKKYFPEEDAGLVMTVSDKKYCLEQLTIWENLKSNGLEISESLFEVIENYL